jgi:hypothetical protein
MKIKLLTLILLTMANTTAYGQNKTKFSKSDFAGKTYRAEVYEMCGKIEGGGFNEHLYCDLQFKKDSVKVTHRTLRTTSVYDKVENSEKSENKTYKWKIRNNVIIIENFTNYGQFIFKNEQLVADKDLIFTKIDENINDVNRQKK